MKNHRNQIQNKREPSSHYVIQSERYLGWLFAFFSVCSTGLLIYSIIIEEALWAILILLFISLAMIIAAFNIGLWKVEVNDKEITYRSTFGCVRKYHFENITKGVYKKSGAFRVYIGEKRIFTFDDNMDNSLFIEQMNRLHIPIWSYSFYLKMKEKSNIKEKSDTKKKTVLFIIMIVVAVSITVVSSVLFVYRGNTSNVNRVVGTSALYDEKMVNKAFDAVENKFASDFKGCTLTELRYDNEVENKFADEMQRYRTLHKQALIIVESNFETDRKAGDLGLIPNETYEGWSWSLVQTDDAKGWEVVEGGWGY
ncbi:DUF6560 family protein [Parablautia sp. Marseille-Q6255]|uniref:DUF6560 family protein n=1 Tax=Parablautia sp. Marseille-Q6255 TaxID=3039593 RepID=UPI0024BD300B|nr:DUF6560 family protein [Parablautia sp. Marseille-Q6255]